MAYDQNTDYMSIMNQQQQILNSTAPGSAEYNAAMQAYQNAQASRNEKIGAMNASGTNTNNYQTTNNYANTNYNGGQGTNTTPAGFTGSTTAVNTGSGTDAAAAKQLVAQMNANSRQWYGASAETQAQLEQQNQKYAEQIKALGGNAVFDAASGTWSVTLPEEVKKQQTTASYQTTPDYGLQSGAEYAQSLADMLKQQTEAAKTQNEAKIDYATQQSITELTRALEDAQGTYKTNQEQIASNALNAMDNSALYAEMRGDKGGIGQAQYNEIQNTAAINAQTVKSAQTKLATDTNRQIADLRAQGEFEKADAVLELTQNYLSSLIDIQQWAAEYNLDVAQFQETIRQWQYEYELKVAEITGEYQGEATLAAKQYNNETLANTASALLSAGVMPNAEQLASLNMTADQAQAYILANQVSSTGSGGNGGSNPTPAEEEEEIDADAATLALWEAAYESGLGAQYIQNHYADAEYGFKKAPTTGYSDWASKKDAYYEQVDKDIVSATADYTERLRSLNDGPASYSYIFNDIIANYPETAPDVLDGIMSKNKGFASWMEKVHPDLLN